MDVDKTTGELSPKCPKCAHGGNVDLFPDKRMCMACGHVYPKQYLSDMESIKTEGSLMDKQKRIEPEPLFCCCNCREDYSFPKEDLRWFNNQLWCSNCFDEIDENGERISFVKLEPFVPKADIELSNAQAEIAALKKERTISAIHGQCEMEENDNEFILLRRELEQTRATLATAEAEIRGAIKLCGEYAINAKEGLYASLALSIGRLKHQIGCELAHKKKLSDFANFGIAANENLFDQLTEALAEIERLKCCGNCEYCNHKIEACEHPDNEPEDIMKGRCEHWRHDAEAAKGEV